MNYFLDKWRNRADRDEDTDRIEFDEKTNVLCIKYWTGEIHATLGTTLVNGVWEESLDVVEYCYEHPTFDTNNNFELGLGREWIHITRFDQLDMLMTLLYGEQNA
jgi:hypothetical protein